VNDPCKNDAARRQLRELIGLCSHLDGLLGEAGNLGPVHQARLAVKLADTAQELQHLLEMTERLAGDRRAPPA
jgi:hypothetical protein